jgi:hypothetical protein
MSAANLDPFALAHQDEGDAALAAQMPALCWPLRAACSAVSPWRLPTSRNWSGCVYGLARAHGREGSVL